MLKEKVAVITGGGGVLCSAFAEDLARCGCKVAVLDLNLSAAQTVAGGITKKGGAAKAYAANVLDKVSLEQVRQAINADLGACDILINGAGGNSPKGNTTNEHFCIADKQNKDIISFFDLMPEGTKQVSELNFMGTFIPTQVFAADMIGRGGVILNMSSMSAFAPLTKVLAYSAAKAAVSNFTMWLAVHFAPAGIRVNALAPGFFDTAQNHNLLFNDDGTPTARTGKILAHTPMGRMGIVEDLLGPMRFLCDDEQSGFITGTVLPIDGGFQAYSGV